MKKEKKLSPKMIQKICNSEGITLKEYYKKEQLSLTFKHRKEKQQKQEEVAEKNLKQHLK